MTLHELPTFDAKPQLTVQDIAKAKQDGYRTIINNRPDFEAPDQPTSAQIQAACESHGLDYFHIPTTAPTSPPDVAAMAEAMAKARGPILAFCRSGTRSTTLWAMVEARNGADIEGLITLARDAGYDLRGAGGALAAAQRDGNHAKA